MFAYLGGHPLIAYTICAARESGVFGAVVVSTDSEEYAKIARYYGAEVPFLRPAELGRKVSGHRVGDLHAPPLARGGQGLRALQPAQADEPVSQGGDHPSQLHSFSRTTASTRCERWSAASGIPARCGSSAALAQARSFRSGLRGSPGVGSPRIRRFRRSTRRTRASRSRAWPPSSNRARSPAKR